MSALCQKRTFFRFVRPIDRQAWSAAGLCPLCEVRAECFPTHCALWTTAKGPLMGLNRSYRTVDVAVGNNENRGSRKRRAYCNWCERSRARRRYGGEGTAASGVDSTGDVHQPSGLYPHYV